MLALVFIAGVVMGVGELHDSTFLRILGAMLFVLYGVLMAFEVMYTSL